MELTVVAGTTTEEHGTTCQVYNHTLRRGRHDLQQGRSLGQINPDSNTTIVAGSTTVRISTGDRRPTGGKGWTGVRQRPDGRAPPWHRDDMRAVALDGA